MTGSTRPKILFGMNIIALTLLVLSLMMKVSILKSPKWVQQEKVPTATLHQTRCVQRMPFYYLLIAVLGLLCQFPSLAPIKRHMSAIDELQLYLTTEPEDIANPVSWWYEKRNTYPRLYRMALDYLNIPGVLCTQICSITCISNVIYSYFC